MGGESAHKGRRLKVEGRIRRIAAERYDRINNFIRLIFDGLNRKFGQHDVFVLLVEETHFAIGEFGE